MIINYFGSRFIVKSMNHFQGGDPPLFHSSLSSRVLARCSSSGQLPRRDVPLSSSHLRGAAKGRPSYRTLRFEVLPPGVLKLELLDVSILFLASLNKL